MASMSTDNLENESIDVSTDWRDLEKWLEDQENYFNQKKIRTDKEKIQHVIMNIDCRHFSKIDNFFKFNQQEQLSYEMMKEVLIKKVKRFLDPKMTKYDERVDGYIDKLNITKIDCDNLQLWLKGLRGLCDGQAKDDYLTIKILSRVHDSKKERVCSSLATEIYRKIDTLVKQDHIGKKKEKEVLSKNSKV